MQLDQYQSYEQIFLNSINLMKYKLLLSMFIWKNIFHHFIRLHLNLKYLSIQPHVSVKIHVDFTRKETDLTLCRLILR